MKALFIGGTGTISTAISKLAVQMGWELYLLNRGNRPDRIPEGAKVIVADANDEESVSKVLKGMYFDVVVDFIVLNSSQVERDIRLFSNRTRQYIFISSASAYQKPLSYFMIDESTPLKNPYWKYSRDKIACEEVLVSEYRENNFPTTIIRPSHTYDERNLPLGVKGKKGGWQVIDRMLKGKPVIIHGDGNSFWTLTHNSDFAKAFVGIMGNSAAIGEAVHITSDETITWNYIYDCIGAALNVEVKKVHISSSFLAACNPEYEGVLLGDKANNVVFDNSKIKRLVPDFTATLRFDQGVRQCVKYILTHTELQIPDPEFDCFCDKVIGLQNKALEMYKES